MSLEIRLVPIDFDEHQAMLYEVRPGWNFFDCAGDRNLQRCYLEANFLKEDYQAWNEGVLTEHSLELLKDTGANVEEIVIKYCYEQRHYKVEIVKWTTNTKSQME